MSTTPVNGGDYYGDTNQGKNYKDHDDGGKGEEYKNEEDYAHNLQCLF